MPSADLRLLRAQLLSGFSAPTAAEASSALASQTSDGDWADIDYHDQTRSDWAPRHHLVRTRALALRGQASGDSRLLDAALAGLDRWTRLDPICPNWWHNQIGNPRLLGEILLAVRDLLPPDRLTAAQPLLERARRDAVWGPDGILPMTWTGANRLWISANRLITGAIFGDESLIRESVSDALQEVRVSSATEEGVQVDGSFHQHGPLLHNGGYGASYLQECVFFLSATRGTPWQPDSGYHRLLADWLLDGTRWMLRGDDIDFGCIDREMTRPWVSIKSYSAPAAFLAEAGLPRATELRDLASAADRAAAPGSLAGVRMYPRADYMVWQSPAACVSVRMHSSRTVRAECCNSEGRRSHHVADGLVALRRTGAEYREIFPVWDWRRLPGTTLVQDLPGETPDSVRALGRTPSVGGVGDGRFGACTQLLDTDALLARKSWFFGPEGVICLGAGIRGLSANRVVTTLDQCLRQGPVEHGGSAQPVRDGHHAIRGARWLRHGPWGFVFPHPTDLTLELGPRTGAWSDIGTGPTTPVTREVFLAALDHGASPSDASYAYAILPEADRSTLDAATSAPPWEILQNTPRLQAVWRPASGLLQAVFLDDTNGTRELTWGAGWRLRVDRECVVQLACDSATAAWHLDVADIRQEGGDVTIDLSGPHPDFTSPRPRTVTFPTGDHAGYTVRVF